MHSGRLAEAIVIEMHRKPTENIENTLDDAQNTKKYPKIPREMIEKTEKHPKKSVKSNKKG